MFETATGFAFPQSLTEKYRPRIVADFIGLEKPRKVLSAFLTRPAPSAWLFTGPPGVGKTTMALALAAQLGAELHKIPSQKCTAANVEETIRLCWYLPSKLGGFHLVLVDEADQMSNAAQLALLSKLDATDPPPQTIFIFTANDTERLEKRFLSRCHTLEFSSYGMREALAAFLAKVWNLETKTETGPDFLRIAKDSTNNVRDALMRLDVEILGR
jgi:DNA polymerase III gamma/tau subunit